MAQIDWNEFVIVESIDLFENEDLPAPNINNFSKSAPNTQHKPQTQPQLQPLLQPQFQNQPAQLPIQHETNNVPTKGPAFREEIDLSKHLVLTL